MYIYMCVWIYVYRNEDWEEEHEKLVDNKYIGKWQEGWHVFTPPLSEKPPPSMRRRGLGVTDADADMITDEGFFSTNGLICFGRFQSGLNRTQNMSRDLVG